MKKNEKVYAVYRLDELNYGNGHVSHNKTFLRRTSAVSATQAINNTKSVLRINDADLFCPYSMDGCRTSAIVAEPV